MRTDAKALKIVNDSKRLLQIQLFYLFFDKNKILPKKISSY
jgi:hypothetical protein